MPFQISNNSKYQWFQFKINHKILTTNKFLLKLKIRDDSLCTFCNLEVETIEHLFCYCAVINELWERLFNLIFDTCKLRVDLDPSEKLFGIYSQRYKNVCLNEILLVVRYFIYWSRCIEKQPTISMLTSLLKENYEIQKYIAKKNLNVEKFEIRWYAYKTLFEEP